MANVLFIGEEYIRENTVFNLNVDIKDIEQSAGVAQDMHIQPILGTTFYNELELAYSAQTLTPDEITLMEYIKPALAYQAAQMTLPFLNYNIKNKGSVQQFGENASSIDAGTFHFLRKEIQNRAEFYTQRLVAYLCKNANLYPSYISSENASNDMAPNHQRSGYKNQIGLYPNGCGWGYIDGTGSFRRFI
jgi:hypothetical protein